jgi:YD repeat-containing protein
MNSRLFDSRFGLLLGLSFLSLLTQASAITDANGDGLDDRWATLYYVAPFTGSLDPDNDGRPNLVEAINWSNPNSATDAYTGWGMAYILDRNGDKMDDGWAGVHMRNNVALLHYDDEDGDLRTNMEESIVGTNPWIVDVPWQSLGGAPEPAVGPGSFTLSFRGISGQGYMIQKSPDLINWEDHLQKWGTGAQESVTIETGTAPRYFFRIQLQQTEGGTLDSDGDGLTDWYELFVFGTDRFDADSDDDGLPDGWEAAYGLNLKNALDAQADGDNDSLKNIDEFDFQMDPRSNDFTQKAAVNAYDSIDRLKTVTKPAQPVVSYTYDDEGNLLTQP